MSSPSRNIQDKKSVQSQSFRNDRSRAYVVLLGLIAVLARISFLFDAERVILGWRQADMASIAMNYLRNGFDFLYPQIYWGGNGPGYVEMEFPLIPYLTAHLFNMLGTHSVVAGMIPFLSGVATVVLMYLLVRRLFGAETGFIAGVIVAVSPMFAFFSQTFVGEATLLCFSVLGIFALHLWCEENNKFYYFLSVISIALAILLKLTTLYLGFPLLYLFWCKYRSGIFREPAFWMFGVLVLLPPLLWYYHAHGLYGEFHNTFGILAGGYNKFARIELLTDPQFYSLLIGRIGVYILSPLVSVALIYGFLRRQSLSNGYLFHVWIGALVLYTFVVAEGSKDMNYYQLPLLLPGAAIAALGFSEILKRIASRSSSANKDRLRRSWLVAIAVLFLINIGLATHLFYSRGDQYLLNLARQNKAIGEIVGQCTASESLIIVATSYGNSKTPTSIDTPPEIFYFSDRRGWYLALTWVTEQEINRLKLQGARYFVIPGEDVMEFNTRKLEFQYFFDKFNLIIDRPDCLIFDLGE